MPRKKAIKKSSKNKKQSKSKFDEKLDSDFEDKNFEDNIDEEDISDENFDEETNEDENFDDSQEFDNDLNNEEDIVAEENFPRSRIRSQGLFKNPWWKRGALKGAIVWLIFVVFFYLMDFLGLVKVVDAMRWGFFLLLLIILGMAWEKILYKFIKL